MTAHNMRTMEILASKSFQLTQRSEEQASYLFKEGQHLACFEGTNELIGQVDYYLEHELERQHIVQAGYAAVQQYGMHKQLKKLLNDLV